jgi:hypothetical protein
MAHAKSVPPPMTDAQTDEIEVDEPVAAAADEYDAQSLDGPAPVEAAPDGEPVANGSRRSRAGRSSRRAAVSGRAGASTSSRRVVTPEMRAARRASALLVLKILLGVAIGGILAFGIWWAFMRVDHRVSTATQALANSEGLIRSIESDIALKAPADAERKRLQAIAALDIPELGYAKATPDRNDPKFAGEAYAARAHELSEQLATRIKEQVERVERDASVAQNLRTIQGGFARLQAMTDAELTNFEKDAANFMENPVMPAASRVERYLDDYKADISTVKVQLNRIQQEKSRRLSAITDLPVQQARGQAAVLVQQEKFKDALALVDDLQATFAGADLAPVRQYVEDAAKQAWETAEATAKENYQTYRSPGTTKDMAEASLQAARTRMEQVAERFGIEEYVAKAKEALERFTP